jgi:hypothetical protein
MGALNSPGGRQPGHGIPDNLGVIHVTAAVASGPIPLAWAFPTLERMRLQGNGPRYCKLGGSVRYREEDLAAWINSRVVNSTSEEINQ